ncbi:MAG: hypothetical protein AVDCRST_MAG93-10109, partial [uncultured Chloroflexia bacterium]
MYCAQCGSIAHTEDRFCGTCGAEIPSDAQAAAPTEEIPTQVHAPQGIPTRSGNRKRVLTIAVGALLVLLAGTGAVAYAAFGPSMDPLRGSGSRPSDAEENPPAQEEPAEDTSPESTSTASVSPDDPPDPAFDGLLPTLKQRTTTAPIMLPAELPSVLKNVAIDRDLEGDLYGIAFFRKPTENVVEGWGKTEVYGTLQAAPENRSRSNEYFEATSVETIELPDGAEATLRRMEPVKEQVGTQGPFWEGRFEEGNHAYTLTLLDDTSREMAAQVLSTMVEVPQEEGSSKERTTPYTPSNPEPPAKSERTSGSEKSPPTQRSRSDLETEAEEAAGDYYRAAGSEDWEYTYDNLDSQTQALFSREEWRKKNQWYADNSPAIYYISSVDLDESS